MDDIYSELFVQGIQLLSTVFGRDSRKVQKWESFIVKNVWQRGLQVCSSWRLLA